MSSRSAHGAPERRRIASWVEACWQTRNPAARALLPLAWLLRAAAAPRRWAYAHWRAGPALGVPVIVVGNLTVGGSGKTPLVIWLARMLEANGYRPGVVSRGYRGRSPVWPRLVTAASEPFEVGDEPVLIAARTGCTVAVGPRRPEAGAMLLAQDEDCDVLIADDGLQHYRLARDLEIVAIDGERRFGNGYCLPAGPLREPPSRLRQVDFVVTVGRARPGEEPMRLVGERAVSVQTPKTACALSELRGSPVHAVAAIGHPQRFFAMLRAQGLEICAHAWPDHHAFKASELDFGDGRPVLMTEKDAVKCRAFAAPHYWYVPVDAVLDAGFGTRVIRALTRP